MGLKYLGFTSLEEKWGEDFEKGKEQIRINRWYWDEKTSGDLIFFIIQNHLYLGKLKNCIGEDFGKFIWILQI